MIQPKRKASNEARVYPRPSPLSLSVWQRLWADHMDREEDPRVMERRAGIEEMRKRLEKREQPWGF